MTKTVEIPNRDHSPDYPADFRSGASLPNSSNRTFRGFSSSPTCPAQAPFQEKPSISRFLSAAARSTSITRHNGMMGEMLRVLGMVVWIAYSTKATACPAGYQSQVALAQSARLIVAVKVEAVTDAPDDGKKDILDDPKTKPGSKANARVVVTESIRGNCAVKSFNLIGGPYETCAPGPAYIEFEIGQTIYLLLDRPLPTDTKTVVITWRCRPFMGNREELNELLNRSEAQRLRMMAHHQKLFPGALAAAEKALSTASTDPAFKPGEDDSYPELACLRLLLCNPGNFRASEYQKVSQKSPWDLLGPNTPDTPPPAGTYLTGDSTTPWQCRALDEALEARAKSHPNEAIDFNRRLLSECLVSELGLDERLTRQVTGDESITALLREVQSCPVAFDLDLSSIDRSDEKRISPTLCSASYALMITDEADDRQVWRLFGLRMGGDAPKLDVKVFMPLVNKRPELFTHSWGGMQLLLSMPDPSISPTVKRIMLETENESRLDEFFAYFAKLGDESACLKTLDRFEQIAKKSLATLIDQKETKGWVDHMGYLVEEMSLAAKRLQPKSEKIQQRLKQLAELFPREKEDEAVISL